MTSRLDRFVPRSAEIVALLALMSLVFLSLSGGDAFAQGKKKGGGGGGGGAESFGGLGGATKSPAAPPAGGGGKKAQGGAGKGGKGGGAGGGGEAGVRVTRVPYRPGAAEKRLAEIESQEGVRLEIVGGVADLDRVLTIRNNGIARYRENGRAEKEGKLGQKHLRELFHLLGQNGIEEMKTEYGKKDPAGDRVMVSLTVTRGTKTRKIISFNDPADLHPAGLDTIVGELERLVDLRLSPVIERRRGGGISMTCRLDRMVYDVSPEAEAGASGKLKPERARPSADDSAFTADVAAAPGAKAGGKGGRGAKKAGAGGAGRSPAAGGDSGIEEPTYGIRVSLELLNQTQTEIPLRFPTEQKYELVVTDDSGAELYRWSTGRPFKLSEERFVLDAGRHLFYEETLPLRDAEGRRFKPGRYRLQYRLLSEPGARGEVEFSVVEPPKRPMLPTLPGGDE